MSIEELKKIKHVYDKIIAHPTFTGLNIPENNESQIKQETKHCTTKLNVKPDKKPRNLKINKTQNFRSPEKKLNPYQKFLKEQSLKTKYKMLSPKSRMKAIAEKWNNKKYLF